MKTTANIPVEWLQNEAYDLHIERVLIDAGIPVVRMNHMTPVVASGDIASSINGQYLIYTWTPDPVPVDPRDEKIAELEAKLAAHESSEAQAVEVLSQTPVTAVTNSETHDSSETQNG